MPPKRPNKRRSEDDGGGLRLLKKGGGKNKREVTYDTYDEAMDCGVDMEEKGERYKDGEKAQRFFEKALDLYKKAYDFNPTYDAAYNQARVLFVLATDFFLPPTSVSYLSTSIELYRHAITLTENTLLHIDAAFNLAQALLEMGEVIEDLHPDRKEQVRALREEARTLLERVMLEQEEFVLAHAEETEIDQVSDDVAEDPPAVDQEAAESGMEVDGENPNEAEAATYETHVPTSTALIDTALLLVETHLDLWTAVEPSAVPTEPQQNAVRSVLDRASRIVPVGRQAELDLAEIKVLLAMDEIVWETYKSEAKFGSGIEKSLEGAVAASTSLLTSLDTHPPEEPTLRAQILSTLSLTHSTIAYRLLFLSPQLPPGPSPLAQGAWYNLSESVKHLGKSLDLPSHPGMAKTYKPTTLLELSKVSLSRARLYEVNDTAKRNLGQLIDNALTYATRSLDALGWGGFVKAGTTSGSAPYQNGWGTEWLSRSAFLQILRIGFFVKNMPIPADIRHKVDTTFQTLRSRLLGLQRDRKLVEGDLERFVMEIEDAEEGMTDVERGFWKGEALAARSQA